MTTTGQLYALGVNMGLASVQPAFIIFSRSHLCVLSLYLSAHSKKDAAYALSRNLKRAIQASISSLAHAGVWGRKTTTRGSTQTSMSAGKFATFRIRPSHQSAREVKQGL